MNKTVKHLLFLPVLALGACASKSDFTVVQNDVIKLKTEAETIKSQSAVSYADVQQIRDDVARLRGSIEESDNRNSNTFSRLGVEDSLLVHQVGNIESRLVRIEQYLGLAKEPDKKDAGKATAAQNDAALLKAGTDKLGAKNYAAAREDFKSLLQKYPKSTLVSDAQFQIAESYFNDQWYEKAILEYQVVIAKYKKSQKRPSALYKQARAFELIGDKANAKARYKDLMSVYPASSEAALAKKRVK